MTFPKPIPAERSLHREGDVLFHVHNRKWERKPPVIVMSTAQTDTRSMGFNFSANAAYAASRININLIARAKGDVQVYLNFYDRSRGRWLHPASEWTGFKGMAWSHTAKFAELDWIANQGTSSIGCVMTWKKDTGWSVKDDSHIHLSAELITLDASSSTFQWHCLYRNSGWDHASEVSGFGIIAAPASHINQLAANFLWGVHEANCFVELT